ncbi:hypothetical protein BGW38_007897, partial [Lunasporangiospora selenospora]
GPWSKNPSDDVHAWIGYHGKKFPCGGYKRGPITTYHAGEIIPVRFWNFNIKDPKKFPPPSGVSQSRHGGGACEFSLSYDGGKTWRCLFSMSWTAWATDQFYHHCANVNIVGVKNGKLPELAMTVVDVKQLGDKINTHAAGDEKSTKSSGPNKNEVSLNKGGYFANGGGAGKKGLNLQLIH